MVVAVLTAVTKYYWSVAATVLLITVVEAVRLHPFAPPAPPRQNQNWLPLAFNSRHPSELAGGAADILSTIDMSPVRASKFNHASTVKSLPETCRFAALPASALLLMPLN